MGYLSYLPLFYAVESVGSSGSSGSFRGWGFGEILITAVVVAACVALAYVAFRQFGVQVPPWFVNVMWIVVVAFVVIFAIRLVLGM